MPTQLGGALPGIGAQGASTGATAGGQTLVAFSYVGGALGIVVSSGIAAYTIYDMVKNESKTNAANKLRDLCEQLEKEHREVNKLYQALIFAMVDEETPTNPLEE